MSDRRPGAYRTLYGLLILAAVAAVSAIGWIGVHRGGPGDGDRPALLLAPFAPVLDTVATMLSGGAPAVPPPIETDACQAAAPAPSPAPPPDPRC